MVAFRAFPALSALLKAYRLVARRIHSVHWGLLHPPPVPPAATVLRSLPRRSRALRVPSAQKDQPSPACALPALHARWARPVAQPSRAPLATTARAPPSLPAITPARPVRSAQQAHPRPACALPASHARWARPAARVCRAPLATTARAAPSLPAITPARPVRSAQQAHPRPACALPASHARWARPAARVCRAPLATTARAAPSRPAITPAHRARCAPPAQLSRNGAASMPFLTLPA
jgi:hypothetical protein